MLEEKAAPVKQLSKKEKKAQEEAEFEALMGGMGEKKSDTKKVVEEEKVGEGNAKNKKKKEKKKAK